MRETIKMELPVELTVTDWGHFVVLGQGLTYKIKIMYVNPGAKMSLQRHKERVEWWFILSGTATIRYLNGKSRILEKSQFMYTPHMNWHQICNEGEQILVINEIQFGNCYEEDVERKS